MSVGPHELVIDDGNWQDHVQPVVNGEEVSRGLFPRQIPHGALPFAEPLSSDLLIPKSEWSARIKEMEETKSRLTDIRRFHDLKSQDQGGIPYCWIHAVISAVRAIRAREGQPNIPLSATACGAQITGFRAVGGWSSNGLKWVVNNGVPHTDFWPENEIKRAYVTEEMKANAALHKVTEWWDLHPRNFDELMSCLLQRMPVCVGFDWWAHAVCAMDPVEVEPGDFGIRIWNSWSDNWGDKGEGVLRGSRKIADDQVAPRVTTASVK